MTACGARATRTTLAEPMRSRWSPSVFDDAHVLDRRRRSARCSPPRGGRRAAATRSRRTSSSPSAAAPSHQVLVRHLSRGNSRLGAARLAGARGRRAVRARRAGRGRLQAGARRLRHRPGRRARHAAGGRDGAARPPVRRLRQGGAWRPSSACRRTSGCWPASPSGCRGDPADVPRTDAERDHRVRRREPLAARAHGDRWGVPWPGAGGRERVRRVADRRAGRVHRVRHQLPAGARDLPRLAARPARASTSSPRSPTPGSVGDDFLVQFTVPADDGRDELRGRGRRGRRGDLRRRAPDPASSRVTGAARRRRRVRRRGPGDQPARPGHHVCSPTCSCSRWSC